MITRRALAAGGLGLGLAAAAPEPALATIERRAGGRLGVFALDTGTGRTLAHRADERFLLCSSFKALLAALVLHRVDQGRDHLDAPVRLDRTALLPHSPVTTAHLAAGTITVGALGEAVVTESDNAGANLLLRRVGGPSAVTAFLRGLGDGVTRLDRTELALNTADGVLDTTTPNAIAGTARTLLLGNALAPASRARLWGWMVGCRTGLARLRAGFPPDWVTGDKTGTSALACNDVAVAHPTRGAPIVVAAYYANPPDMGGDAAEAVLRNVGAAIATWQNRT